MKEGDTLRVLIVDDTIFYRKVVREIVEQLPNVQLAGVAPNGKLAVKKISTLKPHLLILDIEMPEMNGLEVLEYLAKNSPEVGAVMFSSHTQKGSEMTIKALELGAFDFIPKPQEGSLEENQMEVKKLLVPILDSYSRHRKIHSLYNHINQPGTTVAKQSYSTAGDRIEQTGNKKAKCQKSKIVAIGVSTGGPNALSHLVQQIPHDLGVPIVIVQHMPPNFTNELAKRLDSKCSMHVKEAADNEPILPNTIYIAPGGKQMKLMNGLRGKPTFIKITDDFPENGCKPSVDYLFRSIAEIYPNCATGVIMTGMGRDGTLGLKLMKRQGATIIAQDKDTCIVYGMPKVAIDAGIVDFIEPLDKLAETMCSTVRRIN